MKLSLKVIAFAATAVPVFAVCYHLISSVIDAASAVGDAPPDTDQVRPGIIFGLIGTTLYGIAFFMAIGLINYQNKIHAARPSENKS